MADDTFAFAFAEAVAADELVADARPESDPETYSFALVDDCQQSMPI